MLKKKYEPVNMVWIGDSISNCEKMCMQSFLANGHDVILWCYGPIKNLPEGIILADANEIIPKDKIFKHMGSYAAFADLFRWKLMYLKGGWYVDTDVVCLKPFDMKESSIIGWERTDILLTPTILKMEKGHPLAKEMVYCAENPLAIRKYDDQDMKRRKIRYRFKFWKKYYCINWGGTAGPLGLTRLYNGDKSLFKNISILRRNTFYTIPPEEWEDIVREKCYTIEDLSKEAYGLHLWNNMWKTKEIDKNQKFSSNTLIGELMEKYYKD